MEKLTSEHELYLSVGLKNPMKPETFREIVNNLLFENIGYMQSWGVHTKDDYIGIIDDQQETIRTLQQQNTQLVEAITNLANWGDDVASAKRYAQTFIQGGSSNDS